MTAISDPRSGGLAHQIPHLVNDVEPPVKPPPALAIGPAAWIRNNLFSSWLNTLLTIGAGVLGASIIVGVFNWAIYQANWFIINYNLRLFMLGRYEPGAEWRVQLAVV